MNVSSSPPISRSRAAACAPGCAHCSGHTQRAARRLAELALKAAPAERKSAAPAGGTLGMTQASRQAASGARKVAGGVEVVPHIVDGRRVTEHEIHAAVGGLKVLPVADLKLLAENGIRIHLYPTDGLEDGLLGATTVVQQDTTSPWVPTKIRVAVRANLPGAQATPEIVQHEVGHAVAVLRKHDRSEQAAIAYAKKY